MKLNIYLAKKLTGLNWKRKRIKRNWGKSCNNNFGSEGLVYSGDFDQIFKPIKVNAIDPVGSGVTLMVLWHQ